MTTVHLNAATVERPGDRFERDEAELAAASFLARYGGRTVEAYRHDLRGFSQWPAANRRQPPRIGKGNKPATIPLVPRTARTIDLNVGEHHDGPIL